MQLITGPFSAFTNYRNLTWEMSVREVLGRYRGASFGLIWSLISPFLMLGVYTLAFGYILKSRWPGASDSTSDFALILFLGLVCHGLFAEALTRAPGLIVGNSNLATKVVFPLEILSWTVVFSSMFHALLNLLVFLVLYFIFNGHVHWTAIFLPIILMPLALLSVAAGWLLSALGVYLRDINQIMGVVSTALLFLSSAIVPIESLSKKYQMIFRLNPLTFIIDQVRAVAYWGKMPDWSGLLIYTLIVSAVFYVCYFWFQKLRRGFADVL